MLAGTLAECSDPENVRMRKPDFIIGGADNPYLLRWWIIPRNRFFNIYLHKIIRDDDDRALHDHPWWNVSILLRGAYIEVMPHKRHMVTPFMRLTDLPVTSKVRKAGSIVFRRGISAHRLEVARGPVWTLFITGPVIREWGFHCKQGWRHWKEFVNPNNIGERGRGCD